MVILCVTVCVRFSLLGLFCAIVCLCMCGFVVLGLVSSYYAKKLARENVSEMTSFSVEWDVKR